ncbi:type 1 periplasmic binding fold superfamily protein [Flavobacterium sp. A45]|uniref:type 1 periplasmic binding fold superfamily protein n=1 Tax=Flavobacterium sp. A45 TaxID=1945862 RepID=UPI0020C47DA7|nr:type 1 periplasmic binding fold superfamily protein [Flavobacterium sp. A45]
MKTPILKIKNFKLYVLAIATALTFSSCNNDNDDPIPVNEEELITTVTAVFTPEGGGTAVTLQYKDLDGEGANAPVVTVSSAFAKNKTYNGTVTFKNDLANPAEDITSEILEEGEEHQIFYQKTGTLNALTYGTSSSNFDKNGKPIGLQSVFTTTEAASGTLTITLRHEPNKSATNVASGDITNAGGSTDAEVTFSISVL